jgi:phage gp45-like
MLGGVELSHGRTLTVETVGGEDVVEVKSGDGLLELRFKLTEDGVVLQLEGARISLKAEQSIDLDAKSITMHADADLRMRGARVYIN